jgi:hypothetical protein
MAEGGFRINCTSPIDAAAIIARVSTLENSQTQNGQHAAQLIRSRRKPGVVRHRQHPEILGKQYVVVQFPGRPDRYR